MKPKEYERYWKEQRFSEDFQAYPRNRVLQDIFEGIQKGEILDVGCGSGVVSEFFSSQGCGVVGLDLAIGALQKAKKKGLKVIRGSSEALPIKSDSYNMVFCGDLLEHSLDPEGSLTEGERVLKEDGILIASVPNSGFYGARLLYLLTGQVYNMEASGNPPWRWQHIRFYNVRLLRELLKKAGFKVMRVYGAPMGLSVPSGLRMVPFMVIMLACGILHKLTFGRVVNLSDTLLVVAKNIPKRGLP